VLVSVIPMLIEYLRHRAAARRAATASSVNTSSPVNTSTGYVPGSARGRHAGGVNGNEFRQSVADTEDRH
jgi:hypothetical protein